MKKFMMLAAAALLMAGMMVSCQPNGADSKTISGVIKNDVTSIPELVMGKSDADAKKALLDAGFVEGEFPFEAPARKAKKAPRKLAMEAEGTVYVRTVADDFSEYVTYVSADGSVFSVGLIWMKRSVVESNTFADAAQQAFMAAYDKKECPNFVGVLESDEMEKLYLEGKRTNEIKAMIDEIEAMFKAGELTKDEYEMYLEEFAIYDLSGCAGLVAALKTVKYKEHLFAQGEFTDDKAYEIRNEEGQGKEGLLKLVFAETNTEAGVSAIQFAIMKDHMDLY